MIGRAKAIDRAKGTRMTQSKITVQDILFEGHRAAIVAVYESDADGRYRFAQFELIEKKRPGRKPGKRRGRPPGKRLGRPPGKRRGRPPGKRRKKVAASKAE